VKVAVDAMKTALRPHSFLGINAEGKSSIVKTTGNNNVHIVLRGGEKKPNYFKEDIESVVKMLQENSLLDSVMVDCSHGNSSKDHTKQEGVLKNLIEQIKSGSKHIKAVMIESNLYEGNQSIPEDKSQLKYGVSVTDKCIGWQDTERIIKEAAERL
jgi:3-deoxy-7-phosphoheptulonate synthase